MAEFAESSRIRAIFIPNPTVITTITVQKTNSSPKRLDANIWTDDFYSARRKEKREKKKREGSQNVAPIYSTQEDTLLDDPGLGK